MCVVLCARTHATNVHAMDGCDDCDDHDDDDDHDKRAVDDTIRYEHGWSGLAWPPSAPSAGRRSDHGAS